MTNYVLLRLYKSLVRPILEYTNIIWGPHYVLDQHKLESVQWHATKLVPTLKDKYIDQLLTLNLPSLLYRHRRGDLIFLFKPFKRYFWLDYSSFFKISQYIQTRGHSLKLLKPTAHHQCQVNYFSTMIGTISQAMLWKLPQ